MKGLKSWVARNENAQRLVTVLKSSLGGIGFERTVEHDQEFSHGSG